MARIRTIKPDLFISQTLAKVSVEAERTFVGLLTHSDDEGRSIDSAKTIAGALWAERGRSWEDVEQDLVDLAAVGILDRYQVKGRRYLLIVNWHEHQRINRPTPSKLPGPECSTQLELLPENLH